MSRGRKPARGSAGSSSSSSAGRFGRIAAPFRRSTGLRSITTASSTSSSSAARSATAWAVPFSSKVSLSRVIARVQLPSTRLIQTS